MTAFVVTSVVVIFVMGPIARIVEGIAHDGLDWKDVATDAVASSILAVVLIPVGMLTMWLLLTCIYFILTIVLG